MIPALSHRYQYAVYLIFVERTFKERCYLYVRRSLWYTHNLVERSSSMASALAQAEIFSILSRYVFSTHTFLLICDSSCLNLPGASGGSKAIVWTENETSSPKGKDRSPESPG